MGMEWLIEKWKKEGIVKEKSIIEAFIEVPREIFVDEAYKEEAYEDYPLPIGYGQTISQPTTVAIMTQLLQPKKGNKVLEIGTGSGWQAAILGKIVYPGKVYSVEIVPGLVEKAKRNLMKAGIKNVKVILGDGSIGLEKYAPYDRIIVTAASPKINDAWIAQLKEKGILVVPVGERYVQKMIRVKKTKKGIIKEYFGDFMFVPLVGKKGWNVQSKWC